MTRSSRLALGAASALPALSTGALSWLTDAVVTGALPSAAIGLALAGLVAGLAVVLAFVWVAAGLEDQTPGWRLGWVVGLALFGVVTAPVFWALYVRPERAVSA